MKNHYGYGSYRGRGGARAFLKVLAIVLAVVLALLVAGYFFLQQFVVVTDSGIRYDIPFLQGKTPTPTPSPSLVVETPPVVTISPTPTPEPTEPPLHAISLPRTALYDGTAQAQVDAAGGNAAIFDMKADDGTLGYISDLQLAKDLRASDSNPAINAAIQALTGSDLYAVARVSCFKDNTAPYQDNSLAIKTNSGYNWRDPDDLRWASPTSETVRQYLADICVELARLGFDEIVLDNAGYPTEGHLDYIKPGPAYDKSQLSTIVDGFYQQVKAALAPYPDVKLSIRTTEDALDGADLLSGQTAASLAASADRLWVAPAAKDGTDYARILTAAGLEDVNVNLVLTGEASGGVDAETSWAVLSS